MAPVCEVDHVMAKLVRSDGENEEETDCPEYVHPVMNPMDEPVPEGSALPALFDVEEPGYVYKEFGAVLKLPVACNCKDAV